jgi:hypothetical protein
VGIQQQADIDQDFLGIPPDHQSQMGRSDGLGQFPRRRGGGWVRQIALTSFLPGAVVIDFPDDLCAAA